MLSIKIFYINNSQIFNWYIIVVNVFIYITSMWNVFISDNLTIYLS